MTPSPSSYLKRLIAVMSLGLCLSCQRQEGAIAVDLAVSPEVKADCLKVSVYDREEEVRWVVLPRVEGKEHWKIAINPWAQLPSAIVLVASGWLGRCDDEASLTLNSRTAGLEVPFPTSAVAQVSLVLEPPPSGVDDDGDGYRAVAAGGADCGDDDARVHPGAPERCEFEVDANCDGLLGCADPQCASFASCEVLADRLAIVGLPASIVAGECVSPLWVELRDASGLRSATRTTTVTLDGAALFSTVGCSGLELTSTYVPHRDTTTARLSARFPTPGLATLTAKAAGLAAATASVTVQPAPVAGLRFARVPVTQPAGACGEPLLVELLDAQGAPTTAALSQTVALEAQPSEVSGAFFTDDDCAGPAASHVVVLPGHGTAAFRFRGTHAGATTLAATVAGSLASSTLIVTPGPAAQLAVLGPPLALLTSEACSNERKAALRLEIQDAFGNRTTTPTAVACSPMASKGLSLFFFDAESDQCSTPVASVTIEAGQSEAAFLLRADAVGSGTVTVTPHNGLRPASQPLTVAAGNATALAFTTGPQTPQAGECTPAETVLEARDARGTPSSFDVATAVHLGTTHAQFDPHFHFYSRAGCPPASALPSLTFPAGQSQLKLYFRGEKMAAFDLGASTPEGAVAMLRGNSVRAGPPARLSWVPGAQTQVVAGDCSAPYALTVVDAFGNPTAFAVARQLTVDSTPRGLTFDTAVGQCQASRPISFPPGVSVVEVQARGIKAAPYQVSATTPEVSTGASAGLVVVPAAPLLKASPPGPFTAKAGQCMDITFTRQDVFGNPISAKGTGEALEFTPPAGVSVHTSPNDCLSGKGAETSVWLTSGASQLVSVRGTVATVNPVVLPATFGAGATSVSLKVTAGAADHLVFAAFPPSLTGGVCSGTVTLELRDAYGNPAASSGSLDVGMSASPDGGATFFGDVTCATAATSIPLSGTTTSFSLKPSSGGPLSVTVSSTELPGESTSQQWNVQ